jgi:TonB family protein
VLLLVLLLGHQKLLQTFGARTLYALWLSVPLLLLSSALAVLLPWRAAQSEIFIVKVTAQQMQQLQNHLQQQDWLVCLWAAGVVLVVAVIGAMHWSLQRLLQQARLIPASDNDVPTGLCYQSEQLTGPHISGFLQPKVLLPRDFPQRFSPLIWLAYRRYRQDQELACDALVLQDASAQDRIAYSYALVSNLQQAANGWQPLTYHYGDKQMIKQRLLQLQQTKGFSKTAVLASLILVAAGGLWLQQPAYAKAEQPAPELRVEPKYPVQAAQQRITGYVQAQFNIQPDGSVSDVKITKAEPADTFNKEAVRALEKWRYQPSATGTKGATVQLDFMMDPPESGMEQIKVTN